MSEELMEFKNVLVLKNHLSMIGTSELMNIYKSTESYLCFIDIFAFLTEIDSGFLLLNPEFLDKVLSVTQIHRFDDFDPVVKDAINSIIGYINKVNALSLEEKKSLIEAYISYHQGLREGQFTNYQCLIESLAYDAVMFEALLSGDFSSLNSHIYSVISLNYLVKVCPELFLDPKIKDNALKILEECRKNNGLFNKCGSVAKTLRKKINDGLIEKLVEEQKEE